MYIQLSKQIIIDDFFLALSFFARWADEHFLSALDGPDPSQ